MALAAVMLQPWLAQAIAGFRAGPEAAGFSSAIVSIGNDAGDLDSLVSSLAIADWQPVGACGGQHPQQPRLHLVLCVTCTLLPHC